jgi:hypothetical protein
MQDRKKKVIKAVRKAKRKAGAGLKNQLTIQSKHTADPEIDELVNKYVQQNASKNCTDEEDNEEC